MAQEAVLFANEAFYRAFAERDIAAMEQLWAQAAPVACIHPGWSPVVGRERVLAGTDCGFGTFAGYGKIDPDVAFKKLASLVRGAEIATARLWR